MAKGYRRILALICSVVCVGVAQADGTDATLDRVLGGFEHVKAHFVQKVTAQNQSKTAQGTLWIEKPGKFRWEYQKPAQVVVSNGKTLWFYDVDLAQVTIKDVNEVLSDTPAQLLAGQFKWRELFTAKEAPVSKPDSGQPAVLMTTVELTPKSKKSEFKKVTLVVSGNAIVALEWVDQLNQSTQVRLDHWDPSSAIEPQRFEFVVPADVDVVGKPR